jgi:hypothetical protein
MAMIAIDACGRDVCVSMHVHGEWSSTYMEHGIKQFREAIGLIIPVVLGQLIDRTAALEGT